jgi:YidC/Oxa1 family membrane protein insertase
MLALWDGIVAAFNTVMTPLYHAVSALLVGWHGSGRDPGRRQRLGLGALDHRAHDRHPYLADPAVRQADPVQPELQLLQPKMKELQKSTGTTGRSSVRR